VKIFAAFRNLTHRDRRTITIGSAVLLAAWLMLRVVPAAARRVAAAHSRAEAAALNLARAQETLALAPTARESLAVRGQQLVALARRLLAGASPAEASAELSSLVSGAAVLCHVRIVQQESGVDSSASIFTRVRMRVEAEGDATGIAGWLASLEEGAKLVRVRSLAITAPEPGAPPGQPERLRAQLVLDAWSSARQEARP
jgi:hypothetical protein